MKKPTLQPGWLVNLLTRWAKHDLKRESHALGYPSKSPGFSEKTTGGYNHTIPFDFCGTDFEDVGRAIKELREHSTELAITILMYYKPWTVKHAIDAGMAFGNSTYYKRLHSAHAWLEQALMRSNDILAGERIAINAVVE